MGCNWLEGDMSKASRSTDNILFIWLLITLLMFNLWKFIKLHTCLFLYFPMLYFNFKIQKKLMPYSVPPPQKTKSFAWLIADSAGFFYWPFSQASTYKWIKTDFSAVRFNKFPLPQPNVYLSSFLLPHMRTENKN